MLALVLLLSVGPAVPAPISDISILSTTVKPNITTVEGSEYIKELAASLKNFLNNMHHRLPEENLENIKCDIVPSKKNNASETFIFKDLKGKVSSDRLNVSSDKYKGIIKPKKYVEIHFFDDKYDNRTIISIPFLNYTNNSSKETNLELSYIDSIPLEVPIDSQTTSETIHDKTTIQTSTSNTNINKNTDIPMDKNVITNYVFNELVTTVLTHTEPAINVELHTQKKEDNLFIHSSQSDGNYESIKMDVTTFPTTSLSRLLTKYNLETNVSESSTLPQDTTQNIFIPTIVTKYNTTDKISTLNDDIIETTTNKEISTINDDIPDIEPLATKSYNNYSRPDPETIINNTHEDYQTTRNPFYLIINSTSDDSIELSSYSTTEHSYPQDYTYENGYSKLENTSSSLQFESPADVIKYTNYFTKRVNESNINNITNITPVLEENNFINLNSSYISSSFSKPSKYNIIPEESLENNIKTDVEKNENYGPDIEHIADHSISTSQSTEKISIVTNIKQTGLKTYFSSHATENEINFISQITESTNEIVPTSKGNYQNWPTEPIEATFLETEATLDNESNIFKNKTEELSTTSKQDLYAESSITKFQLTEEVHTNKNINHSKLVEESSTVSNQVENMGIIETGGNNTTKNSTKNSMIYSTTFDSTVKIYNESSSSTELSKVKITDNRWYPSTYIAEEMTSQETYNNVGSTGLPYFQETKPVKNTFEKNVNSSIIPELNIIAKKNHSNEEYESSVQPNFNNYLTTVSAFDREGKKIETSISKVETNFSTSSYEMPFTYTTNIEETATQQYIVPHHNNFNLSALNHSSSESGGILTDSTEISIVKTSITPLHDEFITDISGSITTIPYIPPHQEESFIYEHITKAEQMSEIQKISTTHNIVNNFTHSILQSSTLSDIDLHIITQKNWTDFTHTTKNNKTTKIFEYEEGSEKPKLTTEVPVPIHDELDKDIVSTTHKTSYPYGHNTLQSKNNTSNDDLTHKYTSEISTRAPRLLPSKEITTKSSKVLTTHSLVHKYETKMTSAFGLTSHQKIINTDNNNDAYNYVFEINDQLNNYPDILNQESLKTTTPFYPTESGFNNFTFFLPTTEHLSIFVPARPLYKFMLNL